MIFHKTSVFLMVALNVFFLLSTQFNSVLGRRGCASYGHSCFGGMGKRAMENGETEDNSMLSNEALNQMQIILSKLPELDYFLTLIPQNQRHAVLNAYMKAETAEEQKKTNAMYKDKMNFPSFVKK